MNEARPPLLPLSTAAPPVSSDSCQQMVGRATRRGRKPWPMLAVSSISHADAISPEPRLQIIVSWRHSYGHICARRTRGSNGQMTVAQTIAAIQGYCWPRGSTNRFTESTTRCGSESMPEVEAQDFKRRLQRCATPTLCVKLEFALICRSARVLVCSTDDRQLLTTRLSHQ